MRRVSLSLTIAASLAFAATAHAGVITSPTAIIALAGGEAAPGDVQHIIDRSGLTPTFTSGITDFDAYMGADPRHTTTYSGFEWFAAQNSTSASITLDMGAVLNVSRVAFWNDEFSGTATLRVLSCDSAACTTTTELGLFSPINNPAGGLSYGGEVFDIADALTRYIRLDVTGPQANHQGWSAPSIGEVAFDVQAGAVPEPASLLLCLSALSALARRRRR